MTNDVPAAFHEAWETTTYDQSTGDVISGLDSPLTFSSIDEAEQLISRLSGNETSIKLYRAKVLIAIRDQALFKHAVDDETGEYYPSFDKYLKGLSQRLVLMDGTMPRSNKDWMRYVLLLDRQMGFSDAWILRMGYHCYHLLRAVALDQHKQILDEDEPLESGGKRLGKAAFKALCRDVSDKVDAAKDGSLVWTVAETRALVDDILQKKTVKVSRSWDAEMHGERHVRLKGVTIWLDETMPIRPGDLVSLDDFKAAVGSDEVVGLPEGWR